MDTNTTTNASALFDVFVQAKSALEELPRVQAAHKQLSADHEALMTMLNDEEAKVNDLVAELTKTKSALAAKEAELVSAMFREQDATSKLDFVRSILDVKPVVISEAQPLSEANTTIAPEPSMTEIISASTTEIPDRYTDSGQVITQNPEPLPPQDIRESHTSLSAVPDPVPTTPLPYADQDYYFKPSDMSFGEWQSKGGRVPAWYIESEHNYLIN